MKATGFLGISGNGALPNCCYLDAQNRTATINMPQVQTPFVWNLAVNDADNMLNTATGEITMPFTGVYTFDFMFNTDVSSGTHQLISAAEIWNGSAWVKSEYSARQQAIRVGENSQVIYVSTNRFAEGTKLRFPTWASGTGITLQTEVPTAGAGFTIPAARLLITGIKAD